MTKTFFKKVGIFSVCKCGSVIRLDIGKRMVFLKVGGCLYLFERLVLKAW